MIPAEGVAVRDVAAVAGWAGLGVRGHRREPLLGRAARASCPSWAGVGGLSPAEDALSGVAVA